jgi:hypothetical protein
MGLLIAVIVCGLSSQSWAAYILLKLVVLLVRLLLAVDGCAHPRQCYTAIRPGSGRAMNVERESR